MELKKLMIPTKAVWLDFPGFPGFRVKVSNLARKELAELRKRCTGQQFDRKARMIVETLDDEKFVREFTKATVNGWEGLTIAHLESLVLIDTQGQDPESLVDYSLENAELLVSNSIEFDTWLNEVVFDLDNFRSGTKTRTTESSGETV